MTGGGPPAEMDAWVVARPGPMATHPLERVRSPVPEPGPGEVLVEVEACAVCRTDLHLAEGDLAPRRPRTVPGHEVVGRVHHEESGGDHADTVGPDQAWRPPS
ncbi:alcohol dehydrogenase catalytic domain-containing protein, partial [Streptosporangium algeriense]